MKIEICANSRRSAEQAKAGGACRVELCRDLEVGGLTPRRDDIVYCVRELRLRTHVLVRPRAGDFCYTEAEFDQICREVEMCKSAGAHAVVVGFLTAEGCIDEVRTRRIVQLAAPLEVTFHRAFDEIRQDPQEALETVIRCGCTRILTSGCQPSAEAGAPLLRQLVKAAAGRIIILAGAGITPDNAAGIIAASGVTEIHGSCKHTLPDGHMETSSQIVRELMTNLDN